MRTLRQVSETSSTVTTSVGDSASVAQASVAAPSTSSKNVRRVETVILDEDEEDDAAVHVRMVGAETYDLTYSDNDEDWIMFKDPGEGQEEAHFVGQAISPRRRAHLQTRHGLATGRHCSGSIS